MNESFIPLLNENATPPARFQDEPSKPDWYTINMNLCSQLASTLQLNSDQAAELTQDFVDFNEGLLTLIRDMKEVSPPWFGSANKKESENLVKEGPQKVERLARKMGDELSATVLNTDNSAFQKTITDPNNNTVAIRTVVPPAEQAKRNFEAIQKLEGYFQALTALTDEYFNVRHQNDKDFWTRLMFSVRFTGAMAGAYGIFKAVLKAATFLQVIVQQLNEISQANHQV